MGTTGILGVFTRVYLVCSLAELGEFGRALRFSEEAVEIASGANHVYSLAFSYYALAPCSHFKAKCRKASTSSNKVSIFANHGPFH